MRLVTLGDTWSPQITCGPGDALRGYRLKEMEIKGVAGCTCRPEHECHCEAVD